MGGVGIAVSPDGKFVYLTGFDATRGTGQVSAINISINKVIASTPAGDFPTALAVDPSGQDVYATNDYQHGVCTMGCTQDVWDISATTHKVISSTDLGMFSEAVAVAPNGSVYVVSSYESIVSVLGVGSVAVGYFPTAVAISPNGERAYVANQGDGTVSVIDTASLSILATIPVRGSGTSEGGPNGIAITPDGSRAYVTLSNVVSVIDTAANAVVANVTVPDFQKNAIAVTPDGKYVYALGSNLNVIATSTNTNRPRI
jgi:YVTN family beta-propeller protein